MSILDEILATKRDEVTVLRQPQTRALLRSRALDAPPTRDLHAALRREDGRLAVIAECKRRSPSKGELAPDLDPAATARAYAAGGAAAMSVLTDREYFGGEVADLQAARGAVDIPILRKDFTIDEVQVYEARSIGADAILLILAALPEDSLLLDLHDLARSLDLGVLVEAHDAAEVARGVALGIEVLGVNARDLATFGEDLDAAASNGAGIPPGIVAVAESAIRGVDDAAAMAAVGFDAVLVGEALVRSTDPTGLVSAMAAQTVRRRGG